MKYKKSVMIAPDPVGVLQPIKLPRPKFKNRTTVMRALQKRKTDRIISNKKLPLQMLSDLLWAAWGINRKKGPFGIEGRTAASASNSQEIDLYIALEQGVYLYESVPHQLKPIVAGDVRSIAIGSGQGRAGANAPVRIIYVVDIAKFSTAGFQEPGLKDPDVQKSYYYVDTGLIAGNVALFAAANGLTAWFHNCQKAALSAQLKLRPEQHALFAQTIGWPMEH
ncbi:MAG: nitroreductase family protein [Endomicrobiales bacterium]|jgi:hypothetical protein